MSEFEAGKCGRPIGNQTMCGDGGFRCRWCTRILEAEAKDPGKHWVELDCGNPDHSDWICYEDNITGCEKCLVADLDTITMQATEMETESKRQIRDLEADLAALREKVLQVRKTLRYGADEGPVYCSKPECVIGALCKLLGEPLPEGPEGE